MKKINIIQKIYESGVVAVVRAGSVDEGKKICDACLKGNIKAIEVTFTIDGADKLISSLSKEYQNEDVLIGAGTILDSETARIAILAGAKFIVGPNFDVQTAKLCNRYQIPYMPGCMTIKEILEAMEAGCDVIKIFPGSMATPSYIKAVKGPLPYANLMPTGGVSLDNVGEWIKAGAFCVGVGGELTSPAKTGNYELVTKRAEEFVNKVKENR